MQGAELTTEFVCNAWHFVRKIAQSVKHKNLKYQKKIAQSTILQTSLVKTHIPVTEDNYILWCIKYYLIDLSFLALCTTLESISSFHYYLRSLIFLLSNFRNEHT